MVKRTLDFGNEPIEKKEKRMLTREQCQSFINNPLINPFTGKNLTLKELKDSEFVKIQNDCSEYNIKYSHLIEAIMNSALMSNDLDKKKMCIGFFNNMTYINNIVKSILPFTKDIISSENSRDNLYEIKYIINKCKKYGFITLSITPFYPFGLSGEQILFKFIINIQNNYKIEITDDSITLLKKNITDALTHVSESESDNSSDLFIKNYIDLLEKLFLSEILTPKQMEDLEDYYEEMKAFMKGYKLSASQSIDSSSIRSSNRSKSLIAKTEGLEPLPKVTRAELINKLTNICIDNKESLTQQEFTNMKKKNLQTIVQIGNPNKNGQRNCYDVKRLYSYIRTNIKNKKIINDPLNPSHIISPEELNTIYSMMKYHKKDVKHPTDINELKYPIINLKFTPITPQEDYKYSYYSVSAHRIIGKKIAYSQLIGYIPYVETDDADINTGVLIEKIRKLSDDGRLFKYEFLPEFYVRIPTNIFDANYWEDVNDINQALSTIINDFYLY